MPSQTEFRVQRFSAGDLLQDRRGPSLPALCCFPRGWNQRRIPIICPLAPDNYPVGSLLSFLFSTKANRRDIACGTSCYCKPWAWTRFCRVFGQLSTCPEPRFANLQSGGKMESYLRGSREDDTRAYVT